MISSIQKMENKDFFFVFICIFHGITFNIIFYIMPGGGGVEAIV
jgi:hypothetical protein